MTPETRAWLDGLRDFAAAHRERKPLVDVEQPTPEQAAERMIVAADLATRLPTIDTLVAGRAEQAGHTTANMALDPAVVITTSAGGIATVGEWLASPTRGLQPLAARVVAVTELEYRLWCIRTPDDANRLHLNLWSWVKTRVPAQRWGEFARHPLSAGETYWLHRTGVAGAGAADCRHCHLWKWNGRHAALLQPFVSERSVSHFDPQAAGDTGSD